MIGIIAKALGLNSLVVYVLIATLAGGALWTFGYHKYSTGYADGSSHERAAWQKQRDIDIAAREAERKATQAELDRLAAELQLEAQQRKDEQTDADLAKALAATPGNKTICLPRNVGRVLNQAGR